MYDNILLALSVLNFLLFLLLIFYVIYPRYKAKKILRQKNATAVYTDYICAEKLLIIRVFPETYELEANEGVTPNQILEYGKLGRFMYYLIQL